MSIKDRFNDLSALAICYVLFFCRLLLPYMIYVFLLFSISFTVYKLWKSRYEIKQFYTNRLLKYLKSYWIFLLLCLFFVLGLFNSKTISYYLFKEVLALIMIVNISLLTYIIVDQNDKFNQFWGKLKKLLYLVLVVVCILSPLKYYLELTGIYFDFLRTNIDNYYPVGTSLIVDYNFFSLMNISGIILLFFDLSKTKKRSKEFFKIQFFIFCLTNNVIMSSSRRASILLVAIYSIWLLIPFFNFMALKIKGLSKYQFTFPTFLYSILIVFYLLFYLLFTIENNSKNTFLGSIGINPGDFNKSVIGVFGRYGTIFNQTEVEVNNKTEISTEDLGNIPIKTLSSDSSKYVKEQIVFKNKKVHENLEKGKNILSNDNKLSGNRVIRLKYTFDVFDNFTLIQKIFGNGFDYMIIFGNHFYVENGKDFRYDYPHNPILSSLLYSGILGFIFCVFFICVLFLNIFKYFKYLMDLCLIIIIHFYFILFSGNSLFGTPEFLILALIIIQYNVLKSKKNIEVNYKERAIEK